MNKGSTLSTGGLVHARDMFLKMRQDSSHSERLAKGRPSETHARRLLITAYKTCQGFRDEMKQRSADLPDGEMCQEIIASYVQRKPGQDASFLSLITSCCWQEYLEFIGRQILLSQQHKQTYVQSWMRVRQVLLQPLYQRFMKHYFGLVLPFMIRYPESRGVDLLYVIFAGFLAAHITMYPELERALKRERPDLPPSIALLWELVGELITLTPEFVKTKVPFKKMPSQAASSIQRRYYVSRRESLSGDVPESAGYLDPEQMAIARCDMRTLLAQLTPRQRVIVRLQAEDYNREEIAELMNITEETVKTHISRFRKNMRSLAGTQN